MPEEPDVASSSAVPAPPHCRNCGSVAAGAYCSACGQETRTRLPTFMQFMRDAAGRYVALDGKWWKTLGALIVRPGLLTREYIAGRRRRYVRPSRLFLVASLLLFAVLRLEIEFGGVDFIRIDDDRSATSRDRKPGASTGSDASGTSTPTAKAGAPANADAGSAPDAAKKPGAAMEIDDKFDIELGEAADSVPALKQRIAHFNRLPGRERVAQLTDGTLRYGPYAMFLLLPAFAALLKVLYLGSGRRRPGRPRLYGEHLVFAAHNHAFLAFLVAAAIAVPLAPVRAALLAWVPVYLLWSMRVVYGGRWSGTFLRALMLVIAYSVLFGLATAGLIIVAVLLR